MNNTPFLISFLTVSLFAFQGFCGTGDKGKTYGIVNLGIGQTSMTVSGVQSENNVTIDTLSGKKTKDLPVIDLGAGYYLFDSLRTDLSIYYAPGKYKITSGTASINGVTFSGTFPGGQSFQVKNKTLGILWGMSYEFFASSRFSPYLTVGFGYFRDEAKDQLSIKSKKKNYTGYLFGGGVSYGVDSGVDLLVGYKYIGNKNSTISFIDTTTDTTTGLTETLKVTVKKKPVQVGHVGLMFTF